MLRRVMLDSGAFSVWNKGAVIDFDDYLEFCTKHPSTSFYVNLDVIPGRPNEKRTITPRAIEESAKQGWENYQRMLTRLPEDKVIPVYHQHEKTKWLEKYLEFGTPYIGISPANDMTTPLKIKWMKTLRHLLFDGAGRPVVRTHGFAVTSYDLINLWEWHSVDSASWKQCASWGGIYYPRRTNNEWDFTKPPIQIQTSPVLLGEARPDENISSLLRRGPQSHTAAPILDWLDYCGVVVGSFKTRQETQGYKLEKGKEFWFNKKKHIVLETVEKGVVTHFEERAKVNAKFMEAANKFLSHTVKYIYFAGAPMPENYNLEPKLHRRLFTYHDVGTGGEDKGARRCFHNHLKLLKESK